MNWASATDFFHMGGHALYVWGSYGVTAGVLGFELWWLRQARLAALRAVREHTLLNGPDDEAPT